jgi:hypothetical protein
MRRGCQNHQLPQMSHPRENVRHQNRDRSPTGREPHGDGDPMGVQGRKTDHLAKGVRWSDGVNEQVRETRDAGTKPRATIIYKILR